MNNEEMIEKAAEAMVPILEQESNMIWGERSCANILRWTLAKAGLRLDVVVVEDALHQCGTDAKDIEGAALVSH